MTWSEPSCRQILVIVAAQLPLDQTLEGLARIWLQGSGAERRVITALVPPLTHGSAFASGLFPELSKCGASAWNGLDARLADEILRAALLEERPGIFISYVRRDATPAADDLSDALTREGYRVFLDRFCGTPGRPFPDELREAMSTHDAVVLLETQGLRASRWTLWEAAFARRYHLGPLAVHFPRGTQIGAISSRHSVLALPNASLPPNVVTGIVNFVQQNLIALAAGRRAYFETLVRLAAKSKGHRVRHGPGACLSVIDGSGADVGAVRVSAVPGRLRHVHSLAQAPAPSWRVLAGEHGHLAAPMLAIYGGWRRRRELRSRAPDPCSAKSAQDCEVEMPDLLSDDPPGHRPRLAA